MPQPSTLTGHLFSTPAMLAVFDDAATVQAMLDVEAALARAQSACGLLDAGKADMIAACCRAELIDMDALRAAAVPAGNLAIPLVKQLTARVAEKDQAAAGYVHWGATSQDIIDTGLMLQLRAALKLLRAEHDGLLDALAQLAETHKHTVMAGRTWLQQATPTTFGAKAAGWLDAMLRHRQRLAVLERLQCLQFGGAAGTLASLGEHAEPVASALAAALKLELPNIPWHAQRDRIGEFAAKFALLCASLGKIARDISLLAQTEIGELAEAPVPGKGGSSTMPHKQNPVGCAIVLATAARMPGLLAGVFTGMQQENERALGGWQAEWEALPEMTCLTAGALHQMHVVAAGLQVDAKRMRANLDLTKGLLMAEAVSLALARHIGRDAAHCHVEDACREAVRAGRHLREQLAADTVVLQRLDEAALARLFDPANYTGQAAAMTDAVLASYRSEKEE